MISPEIKARLALPTPQFFKLLQRRLAKTSGAFLGLTVLIATLTTYVPSLPGLLAYVCGLCTTGLGFGAAILSLAVEDPAQIPTAIAAQLPAPAPAPAPAAEPAPGLAPASE